MIVGIIQDDSWSIRRLPPASPPQSRETPGGEGAERTRKRATPHDEEPPTDMVCPLMGRD